MRRRKKRGGSEVEINLAAMLDMAFQLLAFFILTFRPAPIEGHLQLHMPPPVPLTNVAQEIDKENTEGQGVNEAFLTKLDLYLFSDGSGDISRIAVGSRTQFVVKGKLTAEKLDTLSSSIGAFFGPDSDFDRVQLVVDKRLRYDNLMRVIDVCTQQKLANGEPLLRISFVDLLNPDTE